MKERRKEAFLQRSGRLPKVRRDEKKEAESVVNGKVRRKKKNAEKRNIVERISVFRGERSSSENLEEDATNKFEDLRSGAKIKQRERLLKKFFIC